MSSKLKGKQFPYYFNGHRKSKYMDLNRAIIRAVAFLFEHPYTRCIEVLRRSDEKCLVLVTRARGGSILIERQKRSINALRPTPSNVIGFPRARHA